MFKPSTIRNLIVLLPVLGTGITGSTAPSIAQMSELGINRGAVQSAVQSAQDKERKSAGSANKDAKANRPAEPKQAKAAKKEPKEDNKPPAGSGQPAARNPSGVPPANEQRYVPDEVVVEVATSMTTQQIAALTQRFRLANLETVDFQLSGTTLVRLRIPDRRTVPTVVRALETDASVLFAQPNYLFALVEESTPASGDGDPAQYEREKMHLREAHQLVRGKVLIAVIDSGIDVAHPDLAGDIAETYDAIGVGVPVHVHGTAIAGGIAAHGRLMGVAPAAQILAIRAFSGTGRAEDGTGTTFAIMKGLDWAVLHRARAINMSFSGPLDPGVARGVAAAHGKGVVLVAAAGNKGATSPPLFPAADRNVIAVTSTDKNDQLPTFANRGPHIAIAAPGVDLLLLAPNNSLQTLSGTSFSSAYVTGVVALMLERKPELSPDALRQALMASARHLGSTPLDDQSGPGLVDAYQAILAVSPTTSSETIPAPVVPAANRQ
jgi:subtilisin family serine protease